MGLADTAELAVRINLTGNASAGIDKLTRKVNGLGGSVAKVGKGVGQMSAGFARAGVVVGAAVVTGIAAAAKAAIDYEDAFAGVRKTVDASESELAKLSDQFRTMAKEIPIAATEFARLGEIAGALGVKTDAIDEFARTTALLGVTTDLTADAAADALGRIGNILGLTADDYDNFGSALVNLGNKGASTEPQIVEITKRFAAMGKQLGLTAAEILGFSEVTASFTGLEPEAAGSALSRFASILTKVTANGGAKFELLNKIAGEDFKKALDKDASGALVSFLKGLEKLDKYEKASALKTLGLDSVYLRQLLLGLADNVDDVKLSLDNADEGWRGNFLNEEAAEKFKTIAQQLILLKNNLMDAGITIGTAFLPALGRATTKLIAFLKVDGNQSALKAIGVDIGNAIDGIEWDKVLSGARQFVGVMKTAASIFLDILGAVNKLPTEIKAAGAALLVLNKASGGLIASGLGNIIGGLVETAVRGLGSTLPGVGKLFAQPVFVTNWPMGGLGGGGPLGAGGKLSGLDKAMNLLGKAIFVGFAAEAASQLAPVVNQFGKDLGSTLGRPDVFAQFGANWDAWRKNAPWPLGQKGAPEFLGGAPAVPLPGSGVIKTAPGGPGGFTPVKPPLGVPASPLSTGHREGQGQIVPALGALRSEFLTSSAAATAAAQETARETTRGATLTAATARTGSAAIVGAIYANRPDIDVVVNVSGTTVSKTIVKKERYGPSTGSRNRDALGTGLLTGGR